MAHAQLGLKLDGKTGLAEAEGAGPVDAAFQAIERICRSGEYLVLCSVNNITNGSEAQGKVAVRLAHQSRVVNGQCADIDIVIASVKAYLKPLTR